MNKIIDLLKESKDAPPMPLEKSDILKMLQCISDDIHKEYLGALVGYIDDLLIIKNVVSSRKSINIFNYITNDLDEQQIERLHSITMYLATRDPIEKVKEISKLTFGNTIPSSDEYSRACELVKNIKNLNVDMREIGLRLSKIAAQLQFSSENFIILNLGEQFENMVIDRIAQKEENEKIDIDFLTSMINLNGIV